MEERIEWRGQNESQIVREEKKTGRLYSAAETSKERAEWRRLQRKNLNILNLPNNKTGGEKRQFLPDLPQSLR